MANIALEDGLDLKKVLTTGSVVHINQDYNERECHFESERIHGETSDLGGPVKSFAEIEKQMVPIDATGFVKKRILEEGGGLPLHKGCTVYIAFSGYWENEEEPFDSRRLEKPMVVNLNDNGLLPGLQMAIETMLVGESSMFLLAYEVMYGELGIPPRIKPKSNCVFYIKLIKSILTPKEGELDLSKPNTFTRVYHEVKLIYGSGYVLYKNKNFPAAVRLFRKAVFMLHDCRLADEEEEQKQERMLVKLYTNLAICYNMLKLPLKACTACNELNRLNQLWNNGKVLFQNAKALRMIGDFNMAEKKLRRAMKLAPDRKEIEAELKLLLKAKESCSQTKLVTLIGRQEVSEQFKKEIDNLVINFKENMDLCKLTLPMTLNNAEMDYIKEACERENLFFNKVQKDYALDREQVSKDQEELQNKLYEGT